MKSTNKRGSFWKLLPVLTLIGLLCLSVQRVEAQQTPQSNAQQSQNWKPVAEARSIILAQVSNLNQQMPGFAEGTPLYDNALRRVAYFKAIIYEVDRGENIATALDNALPAAATLGYSKEASYTSKVMLRALHEEARIMLTN